MPFAVDIQIQKTSVFSAQWLHFLLELVTEAEAVGIDRWPL